MKLELVPTEEDDEAIATPNPRAVRLMAAESFDPETYAILDDDDDEDEAARAGLHAPPEARTKARRTLRRAFVLAAFRAPRGYSLERSTSSAPLSWTSVDSDACSFGSIFTTTSGTTPTLLMTLLCGVR